MAYNKVVYDGDTLIDLTQDDVTPSDVKSGVYFHGADGVRTQGTLVETTYTATSPIDITDNDISHEDSGVTAGTYDGGVVKGSGFYVPSITVDTKGHVTSATDLGNLIPQLSSSSKNLENGNLVTGYQWRYVAGVPNYADAYVLASGNTSASFTLYYYHSAYGDDYYMQVVSVEAVAYDTRESVIVDWSVSEAVTTEGKSNHITLTVSIAEPYSSNIYIKPLVCYGRISM